MGHSNTERLFDRDEQIRHRHQRQKRKKSGLLIDLTIPNDRNSSVKKIIEKLAKYKDLEVEIE